MSPSSATRLALNTTSNDETSQASSTRRNVQTPNNNKCPTCPNAPCPTNVRLRSQCVATCVFHCVRNFIEDTPKHKRDLFSNANVQWCGQIRPRQTASVCPNYIGVFVSSCMRRPSPGIECLETGCKRHRIAIDNDTTSAQEQRQANDPLAPQSAINTIRLPAIGAWAGGP